VYDEVMPSLPNHGSTASGYSCVRYLQIAEVPNQYSIGIFVFAPHARIPLHDHPGMCVLSRVLYGDLQRLSLDLARNQSLSSDHSTRMVKPSNGTRGAGLKSPPSPTTPVTDQRSRYSIDCIADIQSPKRQKNSRWLGNWWSQQQAPARRVPSNLPEGSKLAYKNHVDHLEAPDVTMLYPFEGNLHEFVAGPNGAAVLDVLLPPYANDEDRDCTFYTIHELTSTWAKTEKELCYIVPTGQPENFHCISGQYRNIGGSDMQPQQQEQDDM